MTRVSGVGAALGAVLIAAITVVVFYEVVARYVFAAPTEWSMELTSYALVWCGFFGAAYTLRRGRHVRVDLLLERLPVSAQRTLELFVDLVGLGFSVLVTYQGARFVYQSYITESTSVSPLRVPLFIPELAVPVGAALLALQFLARLLVRAGLAPAEDQP